MDSTSIIPTDNAKIKKGLYVSLACTQCRANHRRCNGEAPCSRCTKLNLECFYEKTKPRGGYRGKKNGNNKKKNECDDSESCSNSLENAIILAAPSSNLSILMNFYTDVYYQTTDFRLCPISLPNPAHALVPEQRFRVLSSVGYAALSLGHINQGHLFVDQAKQYLPQAMSSISMDAAFGFYQLGLCHLLEQDNAAGKNYLKVCNSLVSSIYNKQNSEGNVDLLVTGPYESKPIPQSMALKLRYYYAIITIPASVKELHKRLNSLAKLEEKWDSSSQMLNVTKRIINLRYCGTEEELLSALESIEGSARNFDSCLEDVSAVYIPMFRAMKFAFLKDYNAMNAECDQFIAIFKSLQIHDLTTIKVAALMVYLWSTFDIPRFKIQELITYAQQLSVNFPGYRPLAIKPTFGQKYQDPLGILLQRRLTCAEESLLHTNVDPFAETDVPIFDDNFNFDDILEATF